MSNTVACAAPPAATGGLLIPAIDEAVPVQFCKDLQRSQALARFAQAAKRAGVPLPDGDFLNIEQVVAAQWNQFLHAKYPPGMFDGLAGQPMVGVSDERLEVVINSETRLNAYQLRYVIEPLEEAAAGLGWFVEETLARATSHGHQVYDMGMASYMLDVFHYDLPEFSDQGYAHSLLLQQGDGAPPKLGDIAQATIDELKEQYSFWPSDLLAEVGGHGHLLRQGAIPGAKRPYIMSARKANQWLKRNQGHRLAAVVDVALRLHKAFDKDVGRDFLWNGHEDETETMGALCFICWDDPNLLFEAVGHYEQNQYQGGEAVEAFARRILHLGEASESDMKDLAASAVQYFNRWALLSELLSHFPIWEDDDET